ncbi:hypothetical protein GCM10009827_056550 [Dactylosporangium maewongense]|uniref:Uncharacterized protein n=1 Tax=Dactylosporangium maewongense TaxID=634393 RepID=A0ABN2B2F8_9ACTN
MAGERLEHRHLPAKSFPGLVSTASGAGTLHAEPRACPSRLRRSGGSGGFPGVAICSSCVVDRFRTQSSSPHRQISPATRASAVPLCADQITMSQARSSRPNVLR